MSGPFARTLAVASLVALTCANPGDRSGLASKSSADAQTIAPVPCPAPNPAGDTTQVLCSDPDGTATVVDQYFTVSRDARVRKQVAQTFKTGAFPNGGDDVVNGVKGRYPGKLGITVKKLFEPPAGEEPVLTGIIYDTVKDSDGKPIPDATADTSGGGFGEIELKLSDLPVATSVFRNPNFIVQGPTAPSPTTPLSPSTTYAIHFDIANSTTGAAVGIAADDTGPEDGGYPDGYGFLRQLRIISSTAFNNLAFTRDKRTVDFSLSLDDGCVSDKTLSCGVGECTVSHRQCTDDAQIITCDETPGPADLNPVCSVTPGDPGYDAAVCTSGHPKQEVCDNKDNDCDGLIDDRTVNNGNNTATDYKGATFPRPAYLAAWGLTGLGTSSCGNGVCQMSYPNCAPKCWWTDTHGVGCANAGDFGPHAYDPVNNPDQAEVCQSWPVTNWKGATISVAGNSAAHSLETCDNKDNDCDGAVDELTDDANGPGLGYTTCGLGVCRETLPNCTCNDGDPTSPPCPGNDTQNFCPSTGDVSKKTTEVCDGLDNNCDGTVDEAAPWEKSPRYYVVGEYATNDSGKLYEVTKAGTAGATGPTGTGASITDGTATWKYVAAAATPSSMTQPFYSGSPASTESNLVCHGGVQTCSAPAGSGSAAWTTTVPEQTPKVSYGSEGGAGASWCNGFDDDCDGTIDGDSGVKMRQACWPGTLPAADRNVGSCRDGSQPCDATPGSGAASWGACTGYTGPVSETCNGLDDDCNGSVDDGLGASQCGFGRCAAATANCVGGVAQSCNPDMGQARTEVCNGVDDDCNGSVDKDPSTGATLSQACYTGPAATRNVGICHDGSQTCNAAPVTVNPNSPPAYPGTASWTACGGDQTPQTEVCNGLDDNCDGVVDNPANTICGSATNASATVCSGGTCHVASCNAGTYDLDGSFSNGCECVDDGTATDSGACTTPTNLGTVNYGGATSRTGKLPFSGASDWYEVTFAQSANYRQCNNGTATISFSSNPGSEFKFEIESTSCGVWGGCGATLDTFSFNDNHTTTSSAPDPPSFSNGDCTNRLATWPGPVYVRVFRNGGAVNCDSYTLSITLQ